MTRGSLVFDQRNQTQPNSLSLYFFFPNFEKEDIHSIRVVLTTKKGTTHNEDDDG